MKARAHAKINLSLRVHSVRSDGYHPIVSLAQSVGWSDELELDRAGEDAIEVTGGGAPVGADNLAWRAVTALRGVGGPPLRLGLDKHIAVAAGLGGGSADAATALVLTVAVLGLDPSLAVAAAPSLGADVPFCLSGGTAWMEGIGERLTSLAPVDDFWVALVVPPFELATPSVYRRWDELGGPVGSAIGERHLPYSLRDLGPLGNDLVPAALDLEPELGDWISDVGSRWGQPVMMSGSGPTLFGLFATESEAAEACAVASGARASRAVRPVPVGWEVEAGSGVPGPPWR